MLLQQFSEIVLLLHLVYTPGHAADYRVATYRGRGRGRRADGDKEEWVPCTKLGRLVKAGKIKSLEHIYLFSMPIKVRKEGFVEAQFTL
jgi:hypothetical protein